MGQPWSFMPEPEDLNRDPLGRLDQQLESFEARRGGSKVSVGNEAADGYRLLGQMLGGVLGGLGLGWLLDQFAHTRPWGLLGGLLIGAGLSIYSTIQTALRLSAKSAERSKSQLPASNSDTEER
jgi:ATP synthase protein I